VTSFCKHDRKTLAVQGSAFVDEYGDKFFSRIALPYGVSYQEFSALFKMRFGVAQIMTFYIFSA
jgi:hypothetical protein